MDNRQLYRVNISAPNLINICIDTVDNNDVSGRLYHYYKKEPVPFYSIVELIRVMEELYNEIGFPQASTKLRQFVEDEVQRPYGVKRPDRVITPEQLLEPNGEKGTFITQVKYRQNSNWQGEVYWVEKQEVLKFLDVLTFIKQIDKTLND